MNTTLFIIAVSLLLFNRHLLASPVDSDEAQTYACFTQCVCVETAAGDVSVTCGDDPAAQPAQFTRNDRVTQLDMSHNHLRALPEAAFATFVNLATLDVDGNDIDALKFKFGVSPRHLQNLTVKRNRLSSLHTYSFLNYPSLTRLELTDNPLGRTFPVNRPFLYSSSLEHLRLSRCDLKTLMAKSFVGLQNLRTLDLSHNLLESLDWAVLEPLANLERVYLRGNPWRCGPELDELASRIGHLLADAHLLDCVTEDGESRRWFVELEQVTTEDWTVDFEDRSVSGGVLTVDTEGNLDLLNLKDATSVLVADNEDDSVLEEGSYEITRSGWVSESNVDLNLNTKSPPNNVPDFSDEKEIPVDEVTAIRESTALIQSIPGREYPRRSTSSALPEIEITINGSSIDLIAVYSHFVLIAVLGVSVAASVVWIVVTFYRRRRRRRRGPIIDEPPYENVGAKRGVGLVPSYNGGCDEMATSLEPLYETIDGLD